MHGMRVVLLKTFKAMDPNPRQPIRRTKPIGGNAVMILWDGRGANHWNSAQNEDGWAVCLRLRELVVE